MHYYIYIFSCMVVIDEVIPTQIFLTIQQPIFSVLKDFIVPI